MGSRSLYSTGPGMGTPASAGGGVSESTEPLRMPPTATRDGLGADPQGDVPLARWEAGAGQPHPGSEGRPTGQRSKGACAGH